MNREQLESAGFVFHHAGGGRYWWHEAAEPKRRSLTFDTIEDALADAGRRHAREQERLADAFVSRHVHACASSMVADLADREELADLFVQEAREVEPDQYALVVNHNERGDVGVSVYGPITAEAVDNVDAYLPEVDDPTALPEVWSFFGAWSEVRCLDGSEDFDVTDASEVEPFLISMGLLPSDAQVLGTGDYVSVLDEHYEVYEHWVVSPWLAEMLRDRGEAVAQPWGDMWLWGRTCTGQAISMDCVIRELAREFPHA